MVGLKNLLIGFQVRRNPSQSSCNGIWKWRVESAGNDPARFPASELNNSNSNPILSFFLQEHDMENYSKPIHGAKYYFHQVLLSWNGVSNINFFFHFASWRGNWNLKLIFFTTRNSFTRAWCGTLGTIVWLDSNPDKLILIYWSKHFNIAGAFPPIAMMRLSHMENWKRKQILTNFGHSYFFLPQEHPIWKIDKWLIIMFKHPWLKRKTGIWERQVWNQLWTRLENWPPNDTKVCWHSRHVLQEHGMEN